MNKICTKCKELKSLESFYKNKSLKSGLDGKCKSCKKEYEKQFYSLNEKRLTEYKKSYYKNNLSKILLNASFYRVKNKEQVLSSNKKWYQNFGKDYYHLRYHNDIEFKISCNLRSRFYSALNGTYKTGSAIDDLGCSIEEFKVYIESKFEPWMNWDNHGNYNVHKQTWHIDHILPLSKFDLTNIDQVKIVCHYTNLQPKLALDNLIKYNKVHDE